MRKIKRMAALGLVLTMSMSMWGCGSSDSGSSSSSNDDSSKNVASISDDGKVLNIYCWNDEFHNRFKDYYPNYTEEDDKNLCTTGTISNDLGEFTVNWLVTPSKDNAYQNKLDEVLPSNTDASADDKVDIFLVEADYALKYVNSNVTTNVYDLGLAESDTADMYEYTKTVCTAEDGSLKGVSWQATPGLFAYRRSIAKDVLGTDDPDEVQSKLSNWDDFDSVAAQAKEKGYYMLSGYDDSYRTFSNNVSKKWLTDDNVIQIDDALWQWVDQTKTYTDKGYNQGTSLWDDNWAKGQGPDGKVFGYFYSTWGINFTLMGNSLADQDAEAEVGNGIYGDWAVCEGPAPYYWGGTWICGANGTDNKSLVADIMKVLTCDGDVATQITNDTQDYTNNISAMKAIGASDYASDFLGGQNHIALFAAAAEKIDISNMGPDDQGLNESFQSAMKDYFNGTVTKEEALDTFYKAAVEKYPGISAPEN